MKIDSSNKNKQKIEIPSRKVEQFSKLAKIFKPLYKKKDKMLQEITEI